MKKFLLPPTLFLTIFVIVKCSYPVVRCTAESQCGNGWQCSLGTCMKKCEKSEDCESWICNKDKGLCVTAEVGPMGNAGPQGPIGPQGPAGTCKNCNDRDAGNENVPDNDPPPEKKPEEIGTEPSPEKLQPETDPPKKIISMRFQMQSKMDPADPKKCKAIYCNGEQEIKFKKTFLETPSCNLTMETTTNGGAFLLTSVKDVFLGSVTAVAESRFENSPWGPLWFNLICIGE